MLCAFFATLVLIAAASVACEIRCRKFALLMMKMILVAHPTAEGSWAIRRGREAIERGNRYLRSLFVQATWVVLVKIGPKHWDRYGLQSWIEAAKKRLHHNVLAIALANKLARIAWAVLHKGRIFECVKTNEAAS
jgi:hypothetical protein